MEQIKQHFQRQIQEMLQSQQRHERQQLRLDPPPEFAASPRPLPWSAPPSGPAKAAAAAPATSATNKMSMSSPPPPPPSAGVLLKTNATTTPALSIVSSSMQQQQTDIVNFSNMQRGKSFLEARSAVQRQIEKMFIEANEDGASSGISGGGGGKLSPGGIIKHTMHGVSHIAPEDEDKYCTPPPVHYGVQEALRSRRESAGGGGGDRLSPPARTESKTEKFNSQRSTTVGGYHRGGGLDTSIAGSVSSVGVAGAKTIVDLGNIDIMRRKSTVGGIAANHHRRSATEESLAAQVRLRERSREEQANIRRISVHQDSFDFTPTDDGEESSSGGGAHQLRSPLAASSPLLTTTTATGRLQQQPTAAAAAPTGAGNVRGPKPPAKAKPVRYRIEYLGAVPLRTKASNLDALQV